MEQVERELVVTEVRRAVAWPLVAAFVATIVFVPVAEEWVRAGERAAGERPGSLALLALPKAAADAARTWLSDGLIAADLELLEAIDRTETRLEDESFLRAWLLPRAQGALLEWVGLGNEQVYPGREGWLFYRADFDHVVGRGFLEPGVLEARRRGGDAWQPAPQPDPLIAMIDLERDLAARGVELIVMPTPVKPSVHPEKFSPAAANRRAAFRNASFPELRERLEAAGIAVFDPLPLLAAGLGRGGDALYLATDTHWTPEAMEVVAAALAAELGERFDLGPEGASWLDRPVSVGGAGDLVGMLRLRDPAAHFAEERVTARMVLDPFGAAWRPDRRAPVLVLGDSFTNVFSDPALGWGAGAGLAERLAFHLRRPVDRIALSAGGAHASREALARDLEGGRDRLAGKRVVVYQFAERELSSGDWRRVELPR